MAMPVLAGRSRVDPADLVALQRDTARIRNVCILAHVDHGKTTLSDGLVCSNGIISSKLAGKLRYLDSTADEQQRGITMRSSAISLLYELQLKGKRAAAALAAAEGSGVEGSGAESSVQNGSGAAADSEAGAAAGTAASAEQSAEQSVEASEDRSTDRAAPAPGPYLINLIDSPGHIDFSSDVSTATRLCDTGLVVVDVLEGVCPQTHAVLRQAWKERMRPLLVLNKVDRLISELKLTPLEAWHHLQRLVENVNALTAMLVAAEDMAEDSGGDNALMLNEEAEKMWTFRPEEGEVVFSSALDGWGFGLGQFARLWAKRIGAKPPLLRKMLWGEFAYSAKAKKVTKWTPASAGRPMFVTMILEPIWQLYDAALEEHDAQRTAEMAAALNIEVPPRELKSTELRGLLQSVMKRWLPVADAVLRMVVELGPSPLKAQGARMAALWPRDGALQLQPGGIAPLPTGLASAPPSAATAAGRKQLPEQGISEAGMAAAEPDNLAAVSLEQEMASVRNAIATCATTADAPVVLFVSKMVPVRSTELLDLTGRRWTPPDGREPPPGSPPPDGSEQLTFVAFARIFSGTITPTSKLHILGPKYHPLRPGQNRHVSTLGGPGEGDAGGSAPLALYMMMGSGLHPVPSVAAGNVLAVAGLESQVQKCATLSSTLSCPALTAISLQAKPMVRVAVEAHHQKDMQALEAGLSKLYQADPAVEVSVNDRGEHIVCCLGELHLEQCLKDLREQYARVEVRVSPPLVSFRETVLAPGTLDRDGSIVSAGEIVRPGQMSIPPWSEEEALQAANYRTGRVRCVIASGEVALTVRCSPLPLPVARLLDESPESVRALAVQLAAERQHAVLSTDGIDSGSGTEATAASAGSAAVTALRAALLSAMEECPEELTRAGAITSPPAQGAYEDLLRRVLAFGPRNTGANALALSPKLRVRVATDGTGFHDAGEDPSREGIIDADAGARAGAWRLLENSLLTGFQVACNQGPLCAEEMYGVLFQIECIEVTARAIGLTGSPLPPPPLPPSIADAQPPAAQPDLPTPSTASSDWSAKPWERFGPLSGQVISSAKVACRAAFLACPVRLVEAFYACSLQCDQRQLGNMYAVLGRRRGQVTSEDVVDGTNLFLLEALLPVAESFGFAEELLKKTSGAATTPQLRFSHWGRLALDPFWKPQTEEEREEEGEEGGHLSMGNIARRYIDMTRKRKGMPTAEKIVVAAEKQRNLSLKK